MSVVNRFAALAATAALSVTLVACGGSPGPGGNGSGGDTAKSLAGQTQYNPQPYDNLKDGGTLTTALIEISTQWNPFQGNATGYSLDVWNWYNAMLTTFWPDGKQAFSLDHLTDVKDETVIGNTANSYTLTQNATHNDAAPTDSPARDAACK